jgi:hypothetical protein
MENKASKSIITNLVPGQMSVSEQVLVLAALESCFQEVSELKIIIQRLEDEINRLKGEDGKPNIRGKNQKIVPVTVHNVSSDTARVTPGKPRKLKMVKFDTHRAIDEVETVNFADKSVLPTDVVFKGYAKSHYESLEIRSKLIEVQRAIYYSASQNKTYTADLPMEYSIGSDYTQTLKAHISLFKFSLGLSIPKIGDFLRMHGIAITNGSISNIILEQGESLKSEQIAIQEAGLSSEPYAATDTTASRVDGVNEHTHVFGNDLYSAYFTKPHKDRQTIIDLLRLEAPRTYLLNESTFALYHYLQIPAKVTRLLLPISVLLCGQYLDQTTFDDHLKAILSPKDYEKHAPKLLEGAYLAAYRAKTPLNVLLCDDAPQYKLAALLIAACWVHAGRHFKKLKPLIKYHQQLVDEFLTRFWEFYHQLKAFKANPDPQTAIHLEHLFDTLFDTKTGYHDLDDRILKTKANKHELLVVLSHPNTPLHNNDSELAVRKEVRYRDISFQTRTPKGTQAKDVFFTIIQTATKLGVNAYLYIMDRITKKFLFTPLNELILTKVASM